MSIVCAICSELLRSTEVIFHTQCGHIFHLECLKRWLERSKTCPQCRERTTMHNIHRTYLNFSNVDSAVDDPVCLKDKIDSLDSELDQKNKTIKNLEENTKELECQIATLVEKNEHIESEMKSKNNAIQALKKQIWYYKFQYEVAEAERKQLMLLKEEAEKLKNLKALVDASEEEIEELVHKSSYTQNPDMLSTYVVILKKELNQNCNKMRKYRETIQNLNKTLTKVTMQCNSLLDERVKRKELEETLMNRESERVLLQAKLLDIHVAAYNCICGAISAEKRKCPKECKQHNFQEEPIAVTDESMVNLDETPEIELLNNFCTTILNSASAEETPQNVKSQGFFSMTTRNINKRDSGSMKIPSILTKKSKHSQLVQKTVNSGKAFDGFGGHAKHDAFPRSLQISKAKRIREEARTKRLRHDTGDNQTLNDLLREVNVTYDEHRQQK